MKRGTPSHPKTLALAAALAVERWGAVGILENLWHFAGQYARRGDVGRHGDAAIAAAIGWTGDHGRLVGALVAQGWLDECACHRLRIHDWQDHADQAVHKSKEVRTYGFLNCYPAKHSSGDLPDDGRKKDSGRPEGVNPPQADGRRQTEQGTGQAVGGVQGEEAPPTGATPEEARAEALRVLGPAPTMGSKTGPPNPLVDRDALTVEGYRLIGEIKILEDLDATEVLRQASAFNGHSYVALDAMPENRLAQTVGKLRSWLRRLKGEAEPGPPVHAPPVNEKARERRVGMEAMIQGGLKGAGRELDTGTEGVAGRLPGPGSGPRRLGGAGGGVPPGAREP